MFTLDFIRYTVDKICTQHINIFHSLNISDKTIKTHFKTCVGKNPSNLHKYIKTFKLIDFNEYS